MNISPEISVLMPVYNAERYVAKAIESILNQTFKNFEFIIINDGSTDSSLEIIQKYAQQDCRINLISRANKGIVNTLNEGVGIAKAPYIARMDSDDISWNERLFKQFNYLENHPDCAVIGTSTLLIDCDGSPIASFPFKLNHNEIDLELIQGHGGAIAHPTVMFRKNIFNVVEGYSSLFVYAEDFDLWLKMAEKGNLANLPDVLLYYRLHNKSLSHKFKMEQIDSTKKSVNLACQRRGITSCVNSIKYDSNVESDYSLFLKWGWWALADGNLLIARKYALKAFLKSPFSFKSLKLGLCILRGY